MNLIDLYVSEVGRNLPAKIREDIEKEIRSLIEDMLEDTVNEHNREAEKQGRQPDEAMIHDVLKKMGPPEKVAASYLPPRYLIGPKYFPFFWMVTRIVLTVILIVGAIGLGINLGRTDPNPQNVVNVFTTGFVGLISSLIAAFGNVVLVFVILQWLIPDPSFGGAQKEWDPRQLKAGPDPERVKPGERVAEIVGSIILLLLLNVYPQWLGINSFADGEWVRVRVLTDTFMSYVPWMSALLVAGVALSAYLLNKGRWTNNARWAAIAIHAGSIVMLGMMISGPALAAFDPAELAQLSQTGWFERSPGSLDSINNALNMGMRISLGIALVMQVIDIGKTLLRMAGKRISLPADLTR